MRLLKDSLRAVREAIQLKSPREIEAMRESGRLVAESFAMLREAIRPGVTLRELDKVVTDFIQRRGAQPLYKGYRGNPPNHPPFPGVICASVNEQVCHGVPGKRVLVEGDIVGIDIGLKYNGFCGDACETFPVGRVGPGAERLLRVAQECREKGIAAAQVGRHLSDIGEAIQTHAEKHGYSVVNDWGGHGIGRRLHEPPSVPHTGPGGHGPRLRPGMVFTIEPMINGGGPDWELLNDGWTVVTADGALSAQFEHTIVITERGPEILSKL
jgi:methionyl aminopeptidase